MSEACNHKSPSGAWTCTLPPGHDKLHVGGTDHVTDDDGDDCEGVLEAIAAWDDDGNMLEHQSGLTHTTVVGDAPAPRCFNICRDSGLARNGGVACELTKSHAGPHMWGFEAIHYTPTGKSTIGDASYVWFDGEPPLVVDGQPPTTQSPTSPQTADRVSDLGARISALKGTRP